MSGGGCTARRLRFVREEHGQMFAMAALLFTLILLVGGFAADYGTTYLANSKFRNASDAAALAGANERQRNPGGGEAAVRTVALQYLALHGYVPDSKTTITVTLVPAGAGGPETVRVETTRAQPTFFLRLIGISKVDFAATTEAQNGGGILDVVLSQDITGSMTDQMPYAVQAVRAFLDKINPSTNNPNGPQLALAVFHGAGGNSLEFTPGSRDVQVATFLTQDYAKLSKIIDNTAGAACPSTWPTPQPAWADSSPATSSEICQLKAMHHSSSTYVGNGFEVAYVPNTGTNHYDLWAPALGGRPGAKKVLVVVTDGSNTAPAATRAQEDGAAVSAANAVKLGPDGVIGTSDGLEIYTIGFFDTSSDDSNCATSPTPKCPAAVIPSSPGPSQNDSELISASSSKPGSCDHYYPLNKNNSSNLPTLLTTVANQIL